ncbi:MAG TPA: helix-turn-helix domain-containing protein [Polyangiales bacterium]|nr:helix-turn-helix domain-containing protein [Polyangiales bacterium]
MATRNENVGVPELMTVDDVAAWLRTSRKAVHHLHERGQLPKPKRLGRRLLWERSSLCTWWAERVVSSSRS